MPIAHLHDGPLDGQTHDNEFYGFRAIGVGNVEERRFIGYNDDGAPMYSYPEHIYELETVRDGEMHYRFAETRRA